MCLSCNPSLLPLVTPNTDCLHHVETPTTGCAVIATAPNFMGCRWGCAVAFLRPPFRVPVPKPLQRVVDTCFENVRLATFPQKRQDNIIIFLNTLQVGK